MNKSEDQSKEIIIPEIITVRDLAELMGITPIQLIKTLMSNGILASINQQLDFDTAAIIVAEFGFEGRPPYVEPEEDEEEQLSPWQQLLAEEDEADLRERPPVVTVLGHVDHGKTTLLDAIRKANVAGGESGGITQHVGAYMIKHEARSITFLDTPGHEAFTAMRARGAHTTDIAVLVVAADDGVQPQTLEAIDHARAAHVPILVALNKMDRPHAQPEYVKQQLADVGLMPDEWGGDTMVIPVSAKLHEGLEDLLVAIILLADEIGVQANPNAPAVGSVLEGKLDRRRGPIATVLVQNGTLHTGDVIVVGKTWGRIRALEDENGRRHRTTPPGTPAVVLGLNEVPAAGDRLETISAASTARAIARNRQEAARVRRQDYTRGPLTLDALAARIREGNIKEFNIVLKTDVQGSIEPIVDSLAKLDTAETEINIIRAAAGNITESDINLAAASEALVIGFRVNADRIARRMADEENIEIKIYEIIYQLVDDVAMALQGLLEPVYVEKVIGKAQVRALFDIPSLGQVAGCYVANGVVRRNASVRVYRGKNQIYAGGIASLKRFEDDVREVKQGYECGIRIEGFNALKERDVFLFHVMEREQRA
ncbi:MAG: translation initiation factor IF-2 [Chloroflexota bacterium]|nr:translation initiation factor IF-2 [Chloroflexota bacterium]